MLAAVCTLAVSRVLEGGGCREKRTGVELLMPSMDQGCPLRTKRNAIGSVASNRLRP